MVNTLRTWRCGVAGCNGTGIVSTAFIVSTQGKRGERKQRTAKSVRVCEDCAKAIAKGKLPAALAEEFRKAYRLLVEVE